jgi:hypothetical protein
VKVREQALVELKEGSSRDSLCAHSGVNPRR